MLSVMSPGYFALHRIAAVVLLAFATHWVRATPASTKSAADAAFVIEALGKGTFTLNGPWQFHPGDDPAWASPTFDSSGWEQISADQPWGMQGHPRLTGFAWYRCSIALIRAPAAPQELSLLVSRIYDAYEISLLSGYFF